MNRVSGFIVEHGLVLVQQSTGWTDDVFRSRELWDEKWCWIRAVFGEKEGYYKSLLIWLCIGLVLRDGMRCCLFLLAERESARWVFVSMLDWLGWSVFGSMVFVVRCLTSLLL